MGILPMGHRPKADANLTKCRGFKVRARRGESHRQAAVAEIELPMPRPPPCLDQRFEICPTVMN